MITIVGCGPGGPEWLTPIAVQVVGAATVMVGAERLWGLFPNFAGERIPVGVNLDAALSALEQRLAQGLTQGAVVVLVTGDPGLHSFSRQVVARFGRDRCRCLPGISSVQLACARLCVPWEEAKIISFHGEIPRWQKSLVKVPVLALLGGGDKVAPRMARFAARLGPTHDLYSCRDLGLFAEAIQRLPGELLAEHCGGQRLIVLAIRRTLP